MHAKTLDNSYLNIENISIENLRKLLNENNPHDLDIFEDVNSLVFKLDSISLETDLYEVSVYVCKIDILSMHNLKIAYYKTIFDMDYNIIDDFFVTLMD
ncbi:hypothetical protein ABFO97_04640 [Acinetobacter baumannii]|uniref:hypothetical protein n=1 Tax=Acinetobacter baumannii TaxID=470 RepID=UPI0004610983|nr:hypothetical protein [Acinetobacter baumannii]EIB7123101.1 hypothetical protein [Acinetobacter baumannii]EKU0939892.1 hypothetical protein [Acinetobacter baumannii]EKX7141992.1 hypothetical protein [Acinetobacter baumannii]KCY11333.1 hypothetical protein J599_2196 [Acinetobacter baumannii 1598530]MCT9281586.1 hypothetical protein [Acinetobacter baumannii]